MRWYRVKRKIIKLILVLAFILTIFCNYNVQAIVNPLENGSHYDPGVGGDEDKLMDMTGQILGIVNTVGTIVSVIVLMIIGIKYMLGSIEEKAEYKKSMTGYVFGAILLFGITTIANILYNIGKAI